MRRSARGSAARRRPSGRGGQRSASRLALLAASVLLLGALPAPARAANVLFVADSSGDLALSTALSEAGHRVTVITNDFEAGSNARLRGDLSEFEAIYWSATGSGHTDAAVFESLTSYVMSGGRVFVTGRDALVLPTETMLIGFLGGAGATQVFSTPGPISEVETSLSVGVVDLRGVAPTGSTDNDCLTDLGPGTMAVATNPSGAECAQWSVRALGAGEIAWVSNGSSTQWVVTAAGSEGAYNAAARNFAAAADASSVEAGAPAIVFDAPLLHDEGAAIDVRVEVGDAEGDSFTFSWDLDDDGSFGEREGRSDHHIPAGGTDGPSSLRVGVRAVDEHGNTSVRYRTLRVLNVEPRVRSEPPELASIEAPLLYAMEVEDPAGERDLLRFRVAVGPDGLTVDDEGLVSWTPRASQVTGAGGGHDVEIEVDDGDGGVVTQRWRIAVLANRGPEAPRLLFPSDGAAILERAPRLVAENAEDPDGDTLRYVFQIDLSDRFDSEALRESEPLPETPGFTAWPLETPLAPDRLHHWRVRAHDGLVAGPWASARFTVVSGDVSRADAGIPPEDASAPAALDAGMSGDGSGCRAAPAAPTSRAPWVAALAALIAWRRRRFRRG